MITDHVFRIDPCGGNRDGVRVRRVQVGTCNWRGLCGMPQEDHITVPDYRETHPPVVFDLEGSS